MSLEEGCGREGNIGGYWLQWVKIQKQKKKKKDPSRVLHREMAKREENMMPMSAAAYSGLGGKKRNLVRAFVELIVIWCSVNCLLSLPYEIFSKFYIDYSYFVLELNFF